MALNVVADYPKNLKFNSHIIPGSIKFHKQVGDKYIDGTLSISFKQDAMGFAFLFIGSFLPSPTTSLKTEIPQF